MRTRELVAAGATRSQLAWAVGTGRLVRIRIGHYSLPDLDEPTRRAIRVGGRLACVSALERVGVWVRDSPAAPHVHLEPTKSRLRGPDDMKARYLKRYRCTLHWGALVASADDARVSGIDALIQAIGCLPRVDAIATIDSALRLRVADIRELRQHPAFASLLAHVDARAESGLETYVRVPLKDLGFRVQPQFRIAGVGRVDILVEGRVIVETDGRQFHESVRDRRRDALLTALGYTVLRFDYAQVIHDLPSVQRSIAGALIAHRYVRGSGRRRARALLRIASSRVS